MPQKWKENWSIDNVPVYDFTGNVVSNDEEASEIRSKAVYFIGNMTLLNSKLNSSISNSSFFNKIHGED